jgi:hypothetical protein
MVTVTRPFLAAAIGCWLAACGGGQTQVQTTPTTSAATSTSPGDVVPPPASGTAFGGGNYRGEINPLNNGSVTGVAGMTPSQGGNTTVVNMTLGGPKGTYTYRILAGKCGSTGALMGDNAAYQPVQVGDSGQVTIRKDLNFSTPAGGNYAVVVRQGTDQTSPIVACGTMNRIQP